MRTAVVILNWNTKEYLERFLPGLLSSIGADDQVIVADSASTDGSLELMKEKFPQVRCIMLDKNYGYAGGYDRALYMIEARYYVLINSDIEVSPGWLEPLVKWMDTHPECGACGPKLHSYFKKDTFEYAGAAGGYIDRFGYPFCRGRVLKRVEKDEGQYDKPSDVFWATGACLMVRSELFQETGRLDDKFFAHMEEIDLCWRLQLAGYRVTVVPESVVYHLGGGTLPNNSPWKLFLNFRNNLMMLQKNLGKTYALDMLHSSKVGIDAEDVHKISSKAARKAGRTIFMRKVLDGCSAAVYLCTLKWDYFSSVCKAHKEYRKMVSNVGAEQIEEYIQSAIKGDSAPMIRGMYPHWIVLKALTMGDKVFELVHKI